MHAMRGYVLLKLHLHQTPVCTLVARGPYGPVSAGYVHVQIPKTRALDAAGKEMIFLDRHCP
jgi:hypothetical protein